MPGDTSKPIFVYTDGASLGNPGPGGWAALIRTGGRVRELSGGFRLTTNNRMELYAAIMALESLPAGADVRLYSDSNYLVDGITKGWAQAWRAKGWRQTKTRPTPNADLWQRLLAAIEQRNVHWVWVRGHAGHPENERVNALAQRAASRRDLPPDEGYEHSAGPGTSPQPGLFDDEPQDARPNQKPQLITQSTQPVSPQKKITRAGQPCRKCGAPVEKRIPARKVSARQKVYYEWVLVCPKCGAMYLVEQAKRKV